MVRYGGTVAGAAGRRSGRGKEDRLLVLRNFRPWEGDRRFGTAEAKAMNIRRENRVVGRCILVRGWEGVGLAMYLLGNKLRRKQRGFMEVDAPNWMALVRASLIVSGDGYIAADRFSWYR